MVECALVGWVGAINWVVVLQPADGLASSPISVTCRRRDRGFVSISFSSAVVLVSGRVVRDIQWSATVPLSDFEALSQP